MTASIPFGRVQLDAGFSQALIDAGVADKDARELARLDAFGGSDPETFIDMLRDGQQLQPPPEGDTPEVRAALQNALQALHLDGSALVTACDYVTRGWAPIPIPRRAKAPRLRDWQELRVDAATVGDYFNGRPQNVGVLLGAPSGGLVDVDLDTREAVALAPVFLPTTEAVFGRPTKRRSHWLYVIALPGAIETTKFADVETSTGPDGKLTRSTSMLVELRSTGTQTVFPGSAHEETGELIAWERGGEPAAIDGPALLAAVGKLAAAALLVRHWPTQGIRQDVALALAAVLLRGGWSESDVEQFLTAIAQVAGDDEPERRVEAVEYTAKRRDRPTTGWKRLAELLGARVADRVKDWLALREPDPILNGAVPASVETHLPGVRTVATDAAADQLLHTTDLGNAERLVRQHGRDLRYCYDWHRWLVWDGQRWAPDHTGEALRRATHTVRTIFNEAQRADDDADRKRLTRHALESEAVGRLKAMLEIGSSMPTIPITPDQLDADIWLLNCANGTLDLRTGMLRPHDRTQLLTKLAPVVYDSDASCPTWERFLEQILPDADVRDFVQRAAGYSLTGSVAERVLLVLWGGGRNGKSTMMETLHLVWGEYAMMTPPETLLAKRERSGIPNDIARLKGARLVSVSETEEDKRLAEAAVKQMVGGDTLTARFMHAEFFEFRPHFTPWLRTNHRPIIRGTDEAIWDRIKLVQFNVRISEEQEDKQLPEKLKAELPGILAWVVRGCLLWQTLGLAAPSAVASATNSYRTDMDVFAQFLDDCCIVQAGITATVKAVYNAYVLWAKGSGEVPATMRQVNAALKERGFTSKRQSTGFEWQGLGLAATPQQAPLIP